MRRLLIGLLGSALVLVFAAPANAGVTQISGVAFIDGTGVCGPPPAGYEDFTDYPPIVMTGSLDGCWYTDVQTTKSTPSGAYVETGEEVFVGSLNGEPEGTFATTYKFEAKYAPDGSEIHGRCQHPIAAGSGTDGFAGATGRVDMKDEVSTGEFFYRGHIG